MKCIGQVIGIGIAASATAFGLAAPAAASVITTFQNGVNGYAGTDDNGIIGSSGSEYKNNGAALSTQAGTTPGPSERRALIRFDISALAGQYDSIQSARLELTGTGSAVAADVSVNLHAIADANAGWAEGSGNYANAQPGESTWRFKAENPSAAGRLAWAGSAGLKTAGTDYVAEALDTVVFRDSDTNGQVYTFDLTPALAAQWIAGVNAGLLLFADASAGGAGQFYTSEFSNVSFRPRLVVEYTPVPEPAAGALAAIGTIAMLSRRRRR